MHMSFVIKLFSPYNFSPVKQRCDEDIVRCTYYLVLGTEYKEK